MNNESTGPRPPAGPSTPPPPSGPKAVEVFQFPATGQPLRSVVDADESHFIALDVAALLEMGNVYSSLALLDEDEKGLHTVETPGGPQQMATVTEAGLYSLILRSRKPQAKAFKRWVTHEVLPAIRKTGRYEVAQPDELELAERNVQLIKEKRLALARAEQAEGFKRAIEAGEGISLRAFHKKYFSQVQEKVFFAHLYDRGYLINQRGKGTFNPRTGDYRDGAQHRHPTAGGKQWLYLHTVLDANDERRETTRVRPGQPEIELRDRLARQGLAANEVGTSLVVRS